MPTTQTTMKTQEVESPDDPNVEAPDDQNLRDIFGDGGLNLTEDEASQTAPQMLDDTCETYYEMQP